MSINLDQNLLKVLSYLEKNNSLPIPNPSEIQEAIKEIIGTLDNGLNIGDFKLYNEIERIQHFINQAKEDLRSLQPHDISLTHIPTAKDELSAVVEATEEATGTILDAIENIENMTSKMPEDVRAQVEEHITRVYEACNFQDITGQRIKKVTTTLKNIDKVVEGIIGTFKTISTDNKNIENKKSTEKKAAEEDDEKKLLNGPQLPQNAQSQEDIDALFNS
jgi:chemotaxis protein CheZ